jgi:hypothetical protein
MRTLEVPDMDLLDADDEYILSREVLVNLEAKRLKLGPRPEACADVLRALNLEGLLDFIDSFNPSARAPYHNAEHEAAVVTLVYEAGLFYKLDRLQLRALVITGALHDFDHSAGKLIDSENIARAVKGLKLVRRALATTASALTEAEVMLAESLIKITEYPYTKEPTGLLERIIRDADVMMPLLDPKLRLQLFNGLKAELRVKAPELTDEAFADGVHDFYEKVTWHTEWAKQKAAWSVWPEQLTALKSSLKDGK